MDYIALLNLMQDYYQWLFTLLMLLLYPKVAKVTLRVFEKTVIGRDDVHRVKRARWLIKTAL
ncbi:mechanosensitive ion channel family protein, partial [Vibrio furnissii]